MRQHNLVVIKRIFLRTRVMGSYFPVFVTINEAGMMWIFVCHLHMYINRCLQFCIISIQVILHTIFICNDSNLLILLTYSTELESDVLPMFLDTSESGEIQVCGHFPFGQLSNRFTCMRYGWKLQTDFLLTGKIRFSVI